MNKRMVLELLNKSKRMISLFQKWDGNMWYATCRRRRVYPTAWR